jgi:hypothetical protein
MMKGNWMTEGQKSIYDSYEKGENAGINALLKHMKLVTTSIF